MSNQVIAWDLERDKIVLVTKGHNNLLVEWDDMALVFSFISFLHICNEFYFIGEV